ncbi:hypothetical protein [Lysobacter humi (ex Lee et al. 2017)]
MSELYIHTSGNTLAPALAVLRQRGYSVELLSKDPEMIQASKPGIRLIAEDPLYLLGLASIAEARGSQWPPTDGEVDALLNLLELAR